ncbi:MAG: GldG family protein [Chitinispirillia bacterium]|nr:GldG family protein [Chitinispirillia bacterium]MCL2268070.1 GldG family protein [Chitinispirillia bacterium]
MKKTKIKSRAEVAVVIAAVIAVVALVNYVSNSVFYRLDLTEDRQYTVSNATKRILRNLDDIVTVRVFFSKELPPETHNTVTTVRDLLNEYRNIAGGKLRVSWEDPTNNPEAVNAAMSMGVPEIQLQTFKRDKVEAMKGYMGIGIMYADRKEAIPIVQNLATLEYDLTQAIMKVKRDAIPKIGVLKTQTADIVPPQIRAQMNMNDEVTEKKFAPIFESFKRDYEVVAVDVSEGRPIDRDIRTLIVPGGAHFTERAAFEVDQYFMNGGNLIVLTNAVNVAFTQYGPQANVAETPLLALLEHYGVRVERNLIMDASCGHVMVPRSVGPFTINERLPYPYFVRITGDGFTQDNPVVSAQSDLMLGWVSSLTRAPDPENVQNNITVSILASSSGQSWAVTEPFNLNPQEEYILPAREMLKPHALVMHVTGSFKSQFDGKPIPPAKNETPDEEDEDKISQIKLHDGDKDRSVVSSNTNANLVVVGDATFISAHNASQTSITFFMNMVDWLSLDNNLITIRSRTLRDKTINANVLEAGSGKPGMIRWINLLLMPALAAAAGIIISLKRRERITATPAATAPASVPASESTQRVAGVDTGNTAYTGSGSDSTDTANAPGKEENVNG